MPDHRVLGRGPPRGPLDGPKRPLQEHTDLGPILSLNQRSKRIRARQLLTQVTFEMSVDKSA
eukprot:5737307-Pyramimonas_sp.AAC.1